MANKILFRIISVSLIFFGLMCTINSPEAPTFESNLALPITSKSYFMWKLAEQEENLYADEKAFGFQIRGELDTVYVAENLKYDEALTDNGAFEIGGFELNYQDTLTDSSTLITRLWPPAAKNQGKQIPVLPFQFSLGNSRPFSPRYETIGIDSGFVFINLKNDLGFPIGKPLIVRLGCWRSGVFSEIGMIEIDNPIDSGANELIQIDLSGKEITNSFVITLEGSSPGSGTRLVEIDSLKQKLILQMGMAPVRAKYAIGQIPSLPLETSDWLYLTDESDQISMIESRFTKATLVLNVRSYLNVDSKFDLILNHLYDEQKSVLSIPINLARQDSVTISWPLDHWFLKADITEGINHPKINIFTNGFTESTGSRMEAVSFKDSIVVKARIIDAEMEYVKGTVNRMLIEMDSTREKFEYDYELPDLKFKHTELNLKIYNQIAFPIELNLSFEGERENKVLERYEFRRQIIEPAVVVAGQENAHEKLTAFTISDDRFNDLLNVIPDHITISGSALVGNWGTPGQIRQDDFIYGTYTFSAPFDVAFEDTIISLDTTYLQINPVAWQGQAQRHIDHEISADLTDKMLGARFWAVIENHLPIAAEAIIKIDSSITRIFSTDVMIEKRLDLVAGVTSENGHVINAVCDTLGFDLNPEELDYFKNTSDNPKSLIILVQFRLSGTKGRYVKIFRNDYLSIKESYFIIRYLFDKT